ncbi:hypothetical protein ACI65C_000994 [Semiaphis heraclei]
MGNRVSSTYTEEYTKNRNTSTQLTTILHKKKAKKLECDNNDKYLNKDKTEATKLNKNELINFISIFNASDGEKELTLFKKKKKKKKGDKKLVQNDASLTNEIAALDVEKFYNETCYENGKYLNKNKTRDSNLNKDKFTKRISIANFSADDSLYANCTFKKKKKKKKEDKKMVQNDENLTNEIATLEVEKLYNETCYKSDNHLNKDETRVSDLNKEKHKKKKKKKEDKIMDSNLNEDKLTKKISSANTSAGDSLLKSSLKKTKKNTKKSKMVITEYIDSPKYESMQKNVENLNKDISESPSNEIKNDPAIINIPYNSRISKIHKQYPEIFQKLLKKKNKDMKKSIKALSSRKVMSPNKSNKRKRQTTDKDHSKKNSTQSVDREEKIFHDTNNYNGEESGKKLKLFDFQDDSTAEYRTMTDIAMSLGQYNQTPNNPNDIQGHKNVLSGNTHLQCDFCYKTFISKFCLHRHKKIHTGEKPYTCNVCGRSFSRPEYLINHTRTHTGEKPYACNVCGRLFSQQVNLIIHTRTHTGEKPYACKVCGRSFSKKGSLVVHFRIHSGEKPYACKVCGRSFSQKGSLVVHFRIHSESRKKLELFNSQDDSTAEYRTMTDIAMSLGQYNQTPNNLNDIQGHKNFLSGNTHLQCDFCFKTFISKSKLYRHRRTHTGEKPYTCNVCGRSFTQQVNLIIHTRTHTGEKSYACKVCGRSFSQKGSLVVHFRIHSGEKPYACKVCGRSFSQKGSLVVHFRIHSGEKPYACKVCGRSFSQKGSLVVHFRIHSGERPFECGQCEKKFSTSSNRSRHTRKVHIQCF